MLGIPRTKEQAISCKKQLENCIRKCNIALVIFEVLVDESELEVKLLAG